MDRNIINKFITLFAGNFLNIVIGVITTPIITRLITPDNFGKVSFFNMYSNMLLCIFLLGLDQAFVRYFYEVTEAQKKALLYKCVKLPIRLSIFVGGIIVLVGCILSDKYYIAILFSINLVFLILNRMSMLVIRMQQKVKTYTLLNIAQKILYISLVICFITLTNNKQLVSMLCAITFEQVFITVISIIIERKMWILPNKKEKDIDNNINIGNLVKYGYPYIFTFAITWLFQSADKIAIKYMGTYEDVGIYAGAISIVSLFTIIQTTFNTLWVPIAFEHYNNKPDDKELYININEYISIIMFVFGINLIFGKQIITLFLGENYRAAMTVIPFLIFQPIMYTISETTVQGINFKEKSIAHIWISMGAYTVNVIGNIILVPILGVEGAAISTGISYIVFFSLRTYAANKLYPIKFKLAKFYVVTIAVVLYAGINTFANNVNLNILSYISVNFILCVCYRKTLYKCFIFIKRFL